MAAVTSSGSGERAAFLLRAEGVRGVTFAAAFSVVTAVGCLDTRMKVLMGAVAGGGAATIGFLRGRPRGRPEAPAIFDIWLWFRYFDTLIEERQARVKSDDDAVQLIVRNLEAADSIEVDVNKKVHSAKSWCSSFPSKWIWARSCQKNASRLIEGDASRKDPLSCGSSRSIPGSSTPGPGLACCTSMALASPRSTEDIMRHV